MLVRNCQFTGSHDPLYNNCITFAAAVTSVALIAIGCCALTGVISQLGLTYGIPLIALGTLIGGVAAYCRLKQNQPEVTVQPISGEQPEKTAQLVQDKIQRIILRRKASSNALFVPKNIENQRSALYAKALINRIYPSKLSEKRSITFLNSNPGPRLCVMFNEQEEDLKPENSWILRRYFTDGIFPREKMVIEIEEEHSDSKLPEKIPIEVWHHIASFIEVPFRFKMSLINHAFYGLAHKPSFWRSCCIPKGISPDALHFLLCEKGEEIRDLDLSGVTQNWEMREQIRLFDFLPHYCPNLLRINLSENELTVGLPKLKHLTHLYLRKCTNSENFPSLIPALSQYTSLRVLDLGHNEQFGRVEARALAAILPKLTSIEHLNFESCLMGNGGMEVLASSLPPTLKYLNLAHNHICRSSSPQETGGVKALYSALKQLHSLEYLNLENNGLSSTISSDFVSALPNFSQTLVYLNLASNRISAQDATCLFTAFIDEKPPLLAKLNLNYNPIQEKEAFDLLTEAISYLPSLEHLNVVGTGDKSQLNPLFNDNARSHNPKLLIQVEADVN